MRRVVSGVGTRIGDWGCKRMDWGGIGVPMEWMDFESFGDVGKETGVRNVVVEFEVERVMESDCGC